MANDILDIDDALRADFLKEICKVVKDRSVEDVDVSIKCDEDDENVNYLLLEPDEEDLFDFIDLADFVEVELDPAGQAGIDFYVYEIDENGERSLVRNVRIILTLDKNDDYTLKLDPERK